MANSERPAFPATPELKKLFPAATYAEWRGAAEALLKGKSLESVLHSRTPEGMVLEPIYAPWPEAAAPQEQSLPGQAPFTRGGSAAGMVEFGWHVAQQLCGPAPQDFNRDLLDGLRRGLSAVCFALYPSGKLGGYSAPVYAPDPGVWIHNEHDLAAALAGVDLPAVPLMIDCGTSGLPMGTLLQRYCEESGTDPVLLSGWLLFDPLGELAAQGKMPRDFPSLVEEMHQLCRWQTAQAPGLRCIGINTTAYRDAGATVVQELAVAMATAAEYLRRLLQHPDPHTASALVRAAQFRFATGSDFFMEIAKLRAARQLWARVATAFGADEDAAAMHVHCDTLRWNKTSCDPHTNMLRATTEAMAAVAGGCDSLHIAAFDEPLGRPAAFSQRIARNIHLLLREESAFHRVIDPAGGSWYVEQLTADLAAAAWEQFREIELRGGMFQALKTGFIQKEIADSAKERFEALAQRREILVGVNRYALAPAVFPREPLAATPASAGTDDADITAAFVHPLEREQGLLLERLADLQRNGATLEEMCRALRVSGSERVTPLDIHPASLPFEQLRARVQAMSAPPCLLLALGDPAEYHARCDFSSDFLAIAGLQSIRSTALPDLPEARQALAESNAGVVVFCGSDSRYAEWVAELARSDKQANAQRYLVLAGNPGQLEAQYRAAGVDAFIHRGSDALVELSSLIDSQGGAG